MGYSSRRPHCVPLLSAKNRKRRLQFTQAHQNWTIEDCKSVAWSDESRFLLQHSDGRVRIWYKEHESMDPSCLVSTVQAGGGGVMVRGIFSWHTFGPLSTNLASFKRHSLPEYWMCSWQICSNCVMLSCQYRPKSLRNVSSTLLNLCHEELKQFWSQKGVQPGTSKVYQIKWPMSIYLHYNLHVYRKKFKKKNCQYNQQVGIIPIKILRSVRYIL